VRCRGSCRTITRSVLLERSALTAEPAPRTLKLVTSAPARRAVALRQAACVRACVRACRRRCAHRPYRAVVAAGALRLASSWLCPALLHTLSTRLQQRARGSAATICRRRTEVARCEYSEYPCKCVCVHWCERAAVRPTNCRIRSAAAHARVHCVGRARSAWRSRAGCARHGWLVPVPSCCARTQSKRNRSWSSSNALRSHVVRRAAPRMTGRPAGGRDGGWIRSDHRLRSFAHSATDSLSLGA
jgi:hypothetical protein